MFRKVLLVCLAFYSGLSLAETMDASATTSAVRAESAKTQEAATSGAAPSAAQPVVKPITMLTRYIASSYVGIGLSMQNVRGYTGLMPKVFLGYGTLLGCKRWSLYAGAEIFGSAGSFILTHNQRNRVGYYYGISFLPGVLIYENTLLLARLGYASARYTKLDTSRHGSLVGLGLQTILSQKWDVRFEYDYMPRGNLNQYNMDFVYKFC